MKKIREQDVPGLWTSTWWDIGHGYTVLVQTEGSQSTMHVSATAGHAVSAPERLIEQPSRWQATQNVDVTDRIAGLAFLDEEAVLVSDEMTLSDDEIKRKHLVCPVENVEPVLRRLERAVGVLHMSVVPRLPDDYRSRTIVTVLNFSGSAAPRQRKKEGA